MLCMYGSRCFSQDDPRWSDMTILYAMWYDAMALAYKLLCSSLLLKSLFFFFFVWPLFHNAQTKIAIVYMREQTWGTWDDMITRWYLWYGMYAMGGVARWSLMCTSNVAGNTQMASLDRQVTQNGLGVINAIAREYTMEGYHDTKMIWRLPSLAMMSGGDLDGDNKMMETRP